jgi:hypothetical protein
VADQVAAKLPSYKTMRRRFKTWRSRVFLTDIASVRGSSTAVIDFKTNSKKVLSAQRYRALNSKGRGSKRWLP